MSEEMEGSPYGTLPPAPRPSQDAGVRDQIEGTAPDDAGIIPPANKLDITKLSAKAALKLFTAAISSTVLKADLSRRPPTPPVSHPTTPNSSTSFEQRGGFSYDGARESHPRERTGSSDIPRSAQTPIGSPEPHPHDELHSQPSHLGLDEDYTEDERRRMTLRQPFYSKQPAPVPIQDFTERVHKYCFMSPGVYLAAACYIQRLTGMLWTDPGPSANRHKNDDTSIVELTPKSAHSLIIGALRVAHKALEDNTWSHRRFSQVGGLTQSRLTKMEINLSYMLNFDLRCYMDELEHAAKCMIENNPGVVSQDV